MSDQSPNPPAPGSLAWIAGKSFEELQAIEHGGLVLFPEAFRQKDKRGVEQLTPVLVRPPTKLDRAMGRIDAIKFVAKEICKEQKIITLADAQAAVGADVFEDFDTYGIISRCCFEPDAPGTRAYMLDILLATFSSPTVWDMLDRLTMYEQMLDPRVPEITNEQEFWVYAQQIARAQNLGPLAVMRAGTQRAFVVQMADRLLTLRSFSPSSPMSTQGS